MFYVFVCLVYGLTVVMRAFIGAGARARHFPGPAESTSLFRVR